MILRILTIAILALLFAQGCVTVECYSDEEVSDEECELGACGDDK